MGWMQEAMVAAEAAEAGGLAPPVLWVPRHALAIGIAQLAAIYNSQEMISADAALRLGLEIMATVGDGRRHMNHLTWVKDAVVVLQWRLQG